MAKLDLTEEGFYLRKLGWRSGDFELLDALDEREIDILVHRAVDGMTLAETGARVSSPVSKERCRQMQNIARRKLIRYAERNADIPLPPPQKIAPPKIEQIPPVTAPPIEQIKPGTADRAWEKWREAGAPYSKPQLSWSIPNMPERPEIPPPPHFTGVLMTADGKYWVRQSSCGSVFLPAD